MKRRGAGGGGHARPNPYLSKPWLHVAAGRGGPGSQLPARGRAGHEARDAGGGGHARGGQPQRCQALCRQHAAQLRQRGAMHAWELVNLMYSSVRHAQPLGCAMLPGSNRRSRSRVFASMFYYDLYASAVVMVSLMTHYEKIPTSWSCEMTCCLLYMLSACCAPVRAIWCAVLAGDQRARTSCER